MSFSQKTTARNLFRYKKRFFMTVLGVAGCTALLLIGFGIQDSLLPIVTKQSTELTHNDMSITLSDPKALTMEQGLAEELDSNSAVQNWGAVYTKSTTIYNAEGESASVSIVAAAKDSDLTRYVTFRTRKGHKAISFDSGSVILTEKTAENLRHAHRRYLLGGEHRRCPGGADPDRHHGKLYVHPAVPLMRTAGKPAGHGGYPVEHGLWPDHLHRCCRVQRPAHRPAGLQLRQQHQLYRGHHRTVR
ncbi:MAG: ABC transporter permease [Faecalibacterium prausnitzii]